MANLYCRKLRRKKSPVKAEYGVTAVNVIELGSSTWNILSTTSVHHRFTIGLDGIMVRKILLTSSVNLLVQGF